MDELQDQVKATLQQRGVLGSIKVRGIFLSRLLTALHSLRLAPFR